MWAASFPAHPATCPRLRLSSKACPIVLAVSGPAIAVRPKWFSHGQLSRRLAEVAFADDGVPPVNALGSVPDHFHGDGSRDAGPFETANGGPAEIMRDATRHASLLACAGPGSPEVLDRLPIPMEHVRNNLRLGLLHGIRDQPLRFKGRPEFRRHDEGATLIVLGGPGIKAHGLSGKV